MDETTSERTSKLPRRLPKQPNQVFHVEEPSPAAVRSSASEEAVAEESLPTFEMGPDLPDESWPEFDPQEFTLPEEEPVWTRGFMSRDEAFAPPREFIRSEAARPPLQEPVPPIRAAAPPPPTPRPSVTVSAALPSSPEPQSVRESAPSESKASAIPIGDPKPAFARPSGRSRSRPSRPSGAFAAARLSGSFPAAETATESPAPGELKRSREFVSANVPVAEQSPRVSTQVAAFDDADTDVSPSRVTKSVRKRRVSASAVPALIGFSILLVGYSFAVGSVEGYLESLLLSPDGSHTTLRGFVPWIALTPVVLLLGGVLWIIAGLIGLRHVKPRVKRTRSADGKTRRRRKKERRKAPLELFREEALNEEIDGEAVYQCWRMLQPFGPDHHVLSIYDELEGTLGMRPKDVYAIYQQLVPAHHKEDRYNFRTVLDLLRMVKQASLSKA